MKPPESTCPAHGVHEFESRFGHGTTIGTNAVHGTPQCAGRGSPTAGDTVDASRMMSRCGGSGSPGAIRQGTIMEGVVCSVPRAAACRRPLSFNSGCSSRGAGAGRR